MFEKTIENAAELKRKRDIESKSLTLTRKIELAEDCLKKVKDRDEYLEIEKTLKGLREERELEVRGFYKKEDLVNKEKAEQIVKVANEEINVAEKEYLVLKAKADKIEKKYKEDMEALLEPMKKIENQYAKALLINQFLPYGVDTIDCAIKSDWRIKAYAAALKYQANHSEQIMAIADGRPKVGVFVG